jgi:hypothetical protein
MPAIAVWRKIQVEHQGRLLSGSYACDGKIVEAKSAQGGHKATQVGDLPPVNVARLMLREFADERNA